MELDDYKYWSKSSIYLKALRDETVSFCLSTWYKYCKLLGYSSRHIQKKIAYTSLKTSQPNELWCADVTILKTADGIKQYIHLLMDHFSKKILAFSVESGSSALALKNLLQQAITLYQPNQAVQFLSDGGSENVNDLVSDYLNSCETTIKHLVAQKDIQFSNSTIEMFNKVLKHQFLLPLHISNKDSLIEKLEEAIPIYNAIRPQLSLAGNTPDEVYSGNSLDFSKFSMHFKQQKSIRIAQNQHNKCKSCL